MRVQQFLRQVCLTLLCVAALAVPLLAQNNKGTILGVVTDPQGALVSGAGVTVTNTATGEVRKVTSEADGNYVVSSLVPGVYKITVEGAGFKTLSYEGVTLETNARLAVDPVFTEVAGTGTNTVTVTTESGPLTESETSVRGDIIDARQVTDLPIAQRNFTILAQLSPGVTRPVASTLGGGGQFSSGGPVGSSTESTRFRESGGSVLSANGARVTNNNFTLDGVDNNESQFGQIGIYPNPDAIAEFKIETSVPSAESGRAGGAIVSTTFKSGGNNFHGTGYEFYQGHFAGARPTNNTNPPNFVTHNYGFTVGGPVFLPAFNEGGPKIYNGRNKTFFFFSYNGQRNGTPAFGGEFNFVTVPTTAFRQGDFSALLEPTNLVNFTTVRGVVRAPRGTIFDSNGVAFPNNRIPTALLNTTALNVFNAYPVPTEAGLNNNYRRNRSENADSNGYDIKIDQRVGDKNSLFGRYSYSKNLRVRGNNFPLGTSPNGNDLPSGFGAGDEFGNSRQIALGDTQVFSPSVINDARAGYTRVKIGIFNPGVGGASGFKADVAQQLGIARTNICGVICSGSTLLGVVGLSNGRQNDLEFIGDGGPFYFTSNNFFFGDTLTVIRGAHSFKFGGDLRVRQNVNLDAGRAGSAKGNFVYTTGAIINAGTPQQESLNGNGFFGQREGTPVGPQESANGYANFLLGYRPSSLSRGIPTGVPFLSSKEYAFFVQDDWKVNKNLTMNLGLRYDVFTPQTERYDRQSNFNPTTGNLVRTTGSSPNGRGGAKTDKNNFGPRIGFAYSGLREDRKLVVRGGYGLLYSTDVSGQQPLSSNYLAGGNYSLNFNDAGLAGVTIQTGPPVPTLTSPPDTFRPSSSSQIFYLNPNNKSEIFHQYNVTAQYEFKPNWLAEVGYVGSLGRNLLVVRNIGTDGNGSRQVAFNNVVTTENNGSSSYNSLQTKLERRFSQGLSIISTYTWAHAIDNTPGGFCIQGPGASGCGPSNPIIGLSLDKGNSDLDTRHRFTFANVYDVPFGRNRRFGSSIPKAVDFFIGGFQFNNVVILQSGPVFSVFGSGGRADIIGDPFANTGTRELNKAAFRNPTRKIFPSDANSPVFGSSGRNIFRGQRQEFWDSSLFKNFPARFISEAFNVQLRVQVYNVLNHINHYTPTSNINDADFGLDKANQRQRQLEFSIKILF